MQDRTRKIEREINVDGLRGLNGRRYELATVLLSVVLAKWCGEDKPLGIAEWAKHRKEELGKLLCLNWTSMPHHNTYR